MGLLVLLALAVPLFLNLERYKPGLEAAASRILGMDVRIGGRLRVRFFPPLQVTVDDGRILDARGAVVASATRTRLWIDPLSLLRGRTRLRHIQLTQPRLAIERDSLGKANIEPLLRARGVRDAADGATASVSDGILVYKEARSGKGFEARDIDATVGRLRLAGDGGGRRWNRVAMKGRLTCREIRSKSLSVSMLKAAVAGQDGVLEFKPVTMRVFGGSAEGSLRAMVADSVPRFEARGTIADFRIEELLATLSPRKTFEGTMDLSATLSMRGTSGRELAQTVAGEISMRGEHLTLVGTDLDQELSRFKSSQNFNLLDVGGVFLAGPLSLTLTKGYNFANLLRGSEGSTSVGTLVSDWKLEGGVAHAEDVAMATPKNRIALRGGLDFARQRFDEVTLAAVNADGCATLRQTLRGPFDQPDVEKPHVLASLAGPVLKLVKKTKDLVTPCEVFYSGSVAPPK